MPFLYIKEDEDLHTMVTDGSSRLKPGMELVLTRWIALSGTAKLAEEKEAELLKRFPETLVREARHFSELENTEETLKLAKEVGTDPKTGEDENEYYPLGEGGILKALWEIADRAGLGLSAELRKLPIRQETIEITELFDIDPDGLERSRTHRHLPRHGAHGKTEPGRNPGGSDRKSQQRAGADPLQSGNQTIHRKISKKGERSMREAILTFLEKNSRIDLQELAVILGTDEATVANEIAKMEQEHIICGYHTLIDWDKTSADKVTALIEVRVTPQRGQGFDSIAERIYNYPEVRSVYLISGAYDLMVILEGKTLKEVSGFVSDKLSTLDSVLSTATHFILKKYKDHGTIFERKTRDERMPVTL